MNQAVKISTGSVSVLGTSTDRMNVPAKLRGAFSIGLIAAIAVGVLYDPGAFARTLQRPPLADVLFALTILVLSSALAVLRARLISHDLGYQLRWRDAAAVLSYGNLAGALTIQFFGQLVARGTYLSRRGVPVAATIVMVGYERFLALVVSLTLAAAGAWLIFGRLSFDISRGGDEFIKIILGLMLATAAGAYLCWGKLLLPREITRDTVWRVSRNTVLSFGIQLLTLTAYVLIARNLAPQVPVLHIAAASTVVMFAASLPISLAGWGVRELSAVLTLGVVGVSPSAALVTAVSVGVLSFFVLALLAAFVASTPSKRSGRQLDHPVLATTDYTRWIALGLPLAAATAVFFQLHIPTASGHVNANLADPLAIIGGSVFAIFCFSYRRSWPSWRLSGLNVGLFAATAIIASSLLLGAYRFGWTDWALVNKSLGWLILLGYAGTGALIVSTAGREGLSHLLLTFIAAASAIVMLDLVLLAAKMAGFHVSNTLLGGSMAGFAENRNAFAFQLLMVVAGSCALASTHRNLCTVILGLAFTGLWFAGSRAGWLAAPIVLMFALYLRAISVRQAALALWLAMATTGAIAAIATGSLGEVASWTLYDQSSTSERLKSLQGGLALFVNYPIFGAGLGAYMESVLREGGAPLVIHSTPLWLLAETGLVGFLVFAASYVRIFRAEIARPSHDLASKLLILIMMAFAVMSLPHEMLYQRTFWLLLGAALAYLPSRYGESASPRAANVRPRSTRGRSALTHETANSL